MKQYEFDIALSCAIEDIEIARSIKEELKRLGVKCYFFEDKLKPSRDIKLKTWKIYRKKSKYALVIISENYPKKKWAKEEWEIILGVRRDWDYIIPVRLDNTPLEGLHSNTEYMIWEGKPSHTAISVFSLLKLKKTSKKKYDKKRRKSLGSVTNNIRVKNNEGNITGSKTNN
ncbi:toll/interleukin-1 receptor domain-containing protein [Flavivirga aquimarina]|uniref:Toll/interleukin-1 receptor domain-containing protein n=1 Tax=Flavivirga aquimarina TaxID=2027862 RepID=A0ABT8W723_9FLAO|nr:toll/interleukin-1 receptor domain-containing protein [Flavivirga aquimarina]MDO5968874.1 toll/interleukin-1 receptor domain-containing protein [Flavivirga aquimarina]